MVCRITSTRTAQLLSARGILLAEAMVALAVTAVIILAVTAFSEFSGFSIASLYNYSDLDNANRHAIDQITRDVRQANRVKNCTANVLVLEDADGLEISYAYDPAAQTVARLRAGTRTVMLKECRRMSFTLGQRNTQPGGYDVYPAATPATAKVVNVAWMCSRKILGTHENTESVQTARIVIRKQGT
jgi:hypothetical protein